MPIKQKETERNSKILFATASGFLTILLWSSSSVTITSLRYIPQFELLWLGFGASFIVGIAILALTGRLREMSQPFAPWITAFCGLFFFYIFDYIGLSLAPPAKVTLLSYLWPIMLVICIALMSNRKFHIAYLIGAVMGLIGMTCLMPSDSSSSLSLKVILGYCFGFMSGVVWTIYSVINRRYATVPTGMMIGVCGGISLVSMGLHFIFEKTVMPVNFTDMLIILYLGCGPIGIAFLAWDFATKNANLSLIASFSYLAPLLSTLWLILAGRATASTMLFVAVILIVGGAMVASYPSKKIKGS
ncbi:Permease of the drug/metabolite transporter (DMT) superfamily (RhaT) (PDB:5I20) [Commensalibacter communis]|uniref:DMT family transporter n=1 Tax=Commensalibacter communis TaxID=2972786 RepID=UPI0022FF64BF|nr:DMT family transporter [Commensalibacter communis]CAI3931958.1 Permease of the drug/metabolite transporter (DMT) superfamily (RhaT) (PDB:5I20) [Commensalibacter communis]